jgi:FkbH-like protein
VSNDLYRDLAWLPPPPVDFRQRCRDVIDSADPAEELVRLATHALSEIQLQTLARAAGRAKASGRAFDKLAPFKLGILGNSTLEPLAPALVGTALRHGLDLECVGAEFGQTMQAALSPGSALNAARPDAVLLALDYRGLPLASAAYEPQAASAAVAESIAFLDALRRGLRANAGALCILQTLASPPEAVFGNLDRSIPGTRRNLVAAFNTALVESLAGTPDVILDVASLAETVGVSNWLSPVKWNIGKFAFDVKYLPLYADHVCRMLAAIRGKSRKCLVLDLDNTLWGGLIGDDGLEGIVLGQGDATGEAFLDVQRAALELRARGIVLAVCSKNGDEIARAPFASHPEMLLRERHIAVFQANWNDKASNIAAIARELELGIDSLVFLDDNPVERGLVRAMLPAVAVPELPEDPALYARTLAAAGYFESVTFSDEDRKRADFYRDNARRAALHDRVGDVDAYLESLDMEIGFRPFDATGRSRIVQLINKSNQFNLTTRRYTEAEVAALEADPGAFTLQVRLLDAFGDNGMIGVVICRTVSAVRWEIDTWLMSCRVLGRGVEQMVLRELVLHARERGIETLAGVYLPTAKNALVRDHFEKLGFALVSRDASGSSTWELDTRTEIAGAPMRVERAGFDRIPA